MREQGFEPWIFSLETQKWYLTKRSMHGLILNVNLFLYMHNMNRGLIRFTFNV